jgi:hypothetical protein
MKETELKPRYTEIQELYDYCIKIGIKAELKPMFDGYCLIFSGGGGDFIQHCGSYGHDNGCVEPCISCRLDYTAVPLKNAKALVKRHKDRLNRRSDNEQREADN